MKKTVRFSVLLLAIVLCFGAYGCSKPSEEEVLSAFKELYPKAYELTDYIYGEGLPYTTEGGTDASGYAPVSEDSPYKTEDEFKAAILAVFTEQYYESTLKYVLFESIAPDEQGMVGSAPPRYRTMGGRLYVSTIYEASTIVPCDVESAYVSESGISSATVTARREGFKDKNCDMVLTENGWRFDYRV